MCHLRKCHKRLPVRQSSHYNKKVINEVPTLMTLKFMKDQEYYDRKQDKWYSTPQDHVDLLAEVYGKYIAEHKLPCVSADEQDLSELHPAQAQWIKTFSESWDLVTR